MAQQPATMIAIHETASMDMPAVSPPAVATQLPTDQPKKLRGRERFLQGLRRMTSSTSLTRTGTSSPRRERSYNGLGRGSMSCISLASPIPTSPLARGHSHHLSYSSPDSTTFSTAPTSQSGTPPPDARQSDKNRVHFAGTTFSRSRPRTPLTAPLPGDLRYGNVIHHYRSDGTHDSSDYFSIPTEQTRRQRQRSRTFNFWSEMPHELKVRIMAFLEPKDIIKASAVSKSWHDMCYDGQLWKSLDFSEIYQEIPADSLVKIITQAGPFVKDLNLRGCVQMRDRWQRDGQNISDLCRNMEFLSLKDCKIDRKTIHFFILRNPKLVHIDLSGVSTVNNTAMRILAQTCPQLQYLDVSWCPQIAAAGLEDVVESCTNLKELRAGKMHGWNNEILLLRLFQNNSLETLFIPHCNLDDDSLLLLMQGKDPEIDYLTDRPIVPARKFRHLDLTACKRLTDKSVKILNGLVPDLQSLCLHGCSALTDDSVSPLFASTPHLTHLDLEELSHLTNDTLNALTAAPCAQNLYHLSLSYCESLSDTGVMPLLKACPKLRNLELDNTRVGDLTLHEAAALFHDRNLIATKGTPSGKPEVGLRLVAYDCANVTWTGVLAVLEKNAEFFYRQHGSTQPVYPCEVINLKCFYGFQPTVEEHTKRVLKGELAKATILARKWHDWMQATEEAGAQGAGGWRRRRRAREAERQVEGEGAATDGMPARRRARSGGCVVM